MTSKKSIITCLERAVLAALKTSTALSPLYTLMCPYTKELRTHKVSEAVAVMQIDKRGYRRYKSRYKHKNLPPKADTEGILKAFNKALGVEGFKVITVIDRGLYVEITIKMEEIS